MLGDVTGGYDYNALLYQQDLSPSALYGKYFVYAIFGGMILYIIWPKKHRSRK